MKSRVAAVLFISLAASTCFWSTPAVAQITGMRGRVLLGGTMIDFETAPQEGFLLGIGASAHQRRLVYDAALQYAYGRKQNDVNYTGIVGRVGVGYQIIQTDSFDLSPLFTAGYGGVGVQGNNALGAVIGGSLLAEYTIPGDPRHNWWWTIGLRVGYQATLGAAGGPTGGPFAGITIGRASETTLLAGGCL